MLMLWQEGSFKTRAKSWLSRRNKLKLASKQNRMSRKEGVCLRQWIITGGKHRIMTRKCPRTNRSPRLQLRERYYHLKPLSSMSERINMLWRMAWISIMRKRQGTTYVSYKLAQRTIITLQSVSQPLELFPLPQILVLSHVRVMKTLRNTSKTSLSWYSQLRASSTKKQLWKQTRTKLRRISKN